MAINSHIEWTESTWNPVTGCTKISAGCQNCYAERMARRLRDAGMKKYRNGFKVTLHKSVISEPLSWRKPQIIFTCSMSDLFHEDVPDDFIKQVFDVIGQAKQHQFQILTKRAERLTQIEKILEWPKNAWVGVTVEHADYLERIDYLRNLDAQIKFLSLEPLLGPIPKINLEGIDWVIVGGESGPGARPIDVKWVRSIHKQCKKAEVPFFFKQWGGTRRKQNGRELDGRTWDEMPSISNAQSCILSAT